MMNEKEIAYIERTLSTYKNPRVLEWGSGGSTVYFSNFLRGRGIPFSWVSIEYNRVWYDRVRGETADMPEVSLILFDVGNTELKQRGAPMDEYVSYPTTTGKQYDVIIVDGRKRRRCLEVARTVLAPGGVVFLHDAQRPYYHCAFRKYAHSNRVYIRLWEGRTEYPGLFHWLWHRIGMVFYFWKDLFWNMQKKS